VGDSGNESTILASAHVLRPGPYRLGLWRRCPDRRRPLILFSSSSRRPGEGDAYRRTDRAHGSCHRSFTSCSGPRTGCSGLGRRPRRCPGPVGNDRPGSPSVCAPWILRLLCKADAEG